MTTIEEVLQKPLIACIDKYEEYYAAGDDNTAKAKRQDLMHFREFCKVRGLKILGDWTHSITEAFLTDRLKRVGEKPATARRRLDTVRRMGRIFSDSYPGFLNPARDVRAPKVELGPPKALSSVEIKTIRECAERSLAEKKTFIRFRNLVMFNLVVDTGLRSEEVLGLNYSQVDESGEWLNNVAAKGRKFRNVYISSEMRGQFREYIAWREKILMRYFGKRERARLGKIPVFIQTTMLDLRSFETFRLSYRAFYDALTQLAVDAKFSPHMLRHSFATELCSETGDVRLVAQALGHSDVKTTMRYTERTDEHVARAVERTRRKGVD